MLRRLSTAFSIVTVALVTAASGCSSASNPSITTHRVATSIRVIPQSLGSWTTKAPMPREHGYGAAGVIGKSLLVVGGARPLDALDAYDPATDTWSIKAPMPTGR